MKIESLKELEALLKVCRKQGVTSIEVDGIKMAIGDAPEANSRTKPSDAKDGIEVEPSYTDEEILTWSAGNG